MGRCCEVYDCSNNQGKDISRSYYGFPLDKETCIAWVQFCKSKKLYDIFLSYGHTALRNRKICSDHFAPESFRKPAQPEHGLLPTAKPTRLKVEVVGEYVISYSEE